MFSFLKWIKLYLFFNSFLFALFLVLKKIITFFSIIIFELQQQEAKGKLDNLKYLKLHIRKNKINEENFTQYSLYE